MSSRLVVAVALASALASFSFSTADVRAAETIAAASPPPAPGFVLFATPTASPSAEPVPAPKGKPHPNSAQPPSVAPSLEPASPSAAPLLAPTKTPLVGPPPQADFVYLRDRYRRDDQGAALRKPIKQLAGLDYLLGLWSAHIYTLTPAHKITHDFGNTTYVFARTMNGRWILGTDAKNTEFLYFTYDPPAQHWVYLDVKGFPSYGLSYATGSPRHMQFDAVVESALGDERRLRTTLTSVDAKHFSILDEELTPDDEWTPVVKFDFSRR